MDGRGRIEAATPAVGSTRATDARRGGAGRRRDLFLAGAGDQVDGARRRQRRRGGRGAAKTCLRLMPEQEEGPFYVDLGKVRATSSKGRKGCRSTCAIRVIDHERCVPVANAAVDIWQCNADGVYSDEQSEGTVGQEYLRGIQFTDADGWAELKTIYPGHYAGRATHIHVKVHIGGDADARGPTAAGTSVTPGSCSSTKA